MKGTVGKLLISVTYFTGLLSLIFFNSSFCWQFRVNTVLTYLCKNSLKNTDKDHVASYLPQLPLFGGRDYSVRWSIPSCFPWVAVYPTSLLNSLFFIHEFKTLPFYVDFLYIIGPCSFPVPLIKSVCSALFWFLQNLSGGCTLEGKLSPAFVSF